MKVLVINVRGLHLGYVGCYGNDWVATPNLDRLAAEGVVFDRHYADCPSIEGARRAWRTGCYQFPLPEPAPPVHPGQSPDLIRLLNEHSVSTFLVRASSHQPAADVSGSWQHVCPVPDAGEGSTLERTLEVAVETLDRSAARDSWLVWVDLDTLVPPWELPHEFLERYIEDATEEEDGGESGQQLHPLTDPVPGFMDVKDDTLLKRLQRTYAAAVTYLDAGLGLLFDELQRRELHDDFGLILAADHSLPLGEHGLVDVYRPWLHDELIHLPLIIRCSGLAEEGLRIAALTQPVDLMPTLLDLYEVPVPPVHGCSLRPLLRGETGPVRGYAASGLRVGDAIEWALRSPAWAYLLPIQPAAGDPPRAPQLYVKPDDRWEVNNVVQHHLELAEHLEQTLHGFVAATRRPGSLSSPELRDVEAGLCSATTPEK